MSDCNHNYNFSKHCGAEVCSNCGDHKGLARCFCGWSKSGQDGRKELRSMGEQIDPEPTVGQTSNDLLR